MHGRPDLSPRSERRVAAALLFALLALQTALPLAAAELHPGAAAAGCACPVKMPCCLEGHCPLQARAPVPDLETALRGCPGDAGGSALLPSLFYIPAVLATGADLAHSAPAAEAVEARRFASRSTPAEPPRRPPRA